MGKITASRTSLKPDPKFKSLLAGKFINCMMWSGKKSVATKIFYDAMDAIKKKMPNVEPIDVFQQALDNVKPLIEVRSKRVGGANYQVPMQVSRKRQQSLAFRWILQATRSEKGKPMAQRLSKELMDAAKGEGKAVNTREQTHRMADANKAFAHFAW